MSVLKRLQVSGVRSFDPDGSNAQTINFFTPITLIVGHNGCGKTTIIESLRYAVTNQPPPGTSGGRFFVNDPKLTTNAEILGKIMLEITDIAGNSIQCTKRMKLTQSRGKQTFQRLEGVIRLQKKDGTVSENSSKCLDLNVEMCRYLGVSEAILNNVIFCHQEDSCWPLDEGKSVKERFDAIFNTVRYMMALKVLDDQDKEAGNQLKVEKEAYHYAEQNMEKLRKKRRDLETKAAEVAAATHTEEGLQEKVDELVRQLKEIEKLEARTNAMAADVATCEEKIRAGERSVVEVKNRIKNLFSGSLEELQEKIQGWAQVAEQKKQEKEEIEDALESKEGEVRRFQAQLKQFLVEEGKLQAAETANAERLVSLKNICCCSVLSIVEGIGSSAQNQPALASFIETAEEDAGKVSPQELIGALTIVTKLKQEELENLTAKLKAEENALQNKVGDFQGQKASVETEMKMHHTQCEKNEKMVQELKTRLEAIEGSSDLLAVYDDEETEISRKIMEIEEVGIIDKYEKQIGKLEKDIEKLDAEVEEAEATKELLQEDQTRKDQIGVAKRSRQGKQNECNELISQSNDAVQYLLGKETTWDQGLNVKIKEKIASLANEVAAREKQLKAETANQSRKKYTLDQTKAEIQKLEKEISGWKKKLEEVMDDDSDLSFEEQYATMVEELEETQKSANFSEAAEYLYSKQIKAIDKSSNCPTCKRDFKDKAAAKKVQLSLENQIEKVLTKKPEDEKRVEELKSVLAKWNSLKSNYDEKMKLEQETLPGLKTRQKTLEEELKNIEETIEDLEMAVDTGKNDLSMARDLVPAVTSFAQHLKEIAKLDETIKKLESERNPKAKGIKLTLEEVKANFDEIKSSLASKRAEASRTEKLKSKKKGELEDLKQQKNNVQAEKLKLQSEIQNREAFVAQKKELEQATTELRQKLAVLDKKVANLKNEIVMAQKSKDKFVKYKEDEMQKVQQVVDQMKNYITSAQELKKQISDFERSKDNFAVAQRKIQKTKDFLKSLEDEIAKFRKGLERLHQEIANHKISEIDLNDNLLLMNKKSELSSLNEQYAEMKKKYNDTVQAGGLASQKRALSAKYQTASAKLNEHKGTYQQVKKQMAELESEIRTDHKFTEEDYKDRLIKHIVLEKSQLDIRKFKKALDYAIMTFHKKRMEAINRALKAYWKMVYKGNDIEEIQIRTEDENEGQKKINLNPMGRKSYSYRVVMVKQGMELDMRGRCSAGQKMLACILIRIALAEAFSSKCGIITLDEPTTNLDADNVKALAECLARLAERMSRSKTFQLVVITHDQDFMDYLLDVDSISSFYKVTRNIQGFSKITQVQK